MGMVPTVANHTLCLEGLQQDVLNLGRICTLHKNSLYSHGQFIQTSVEREHMSLEDVNVGSSSSLTLEDLSIPPTEGREVPTLIARPSYGAPLFDQYWYICEMLAPKTLDLCKALNSTDVTRIFEMTAKRWRDISNVD